jgi:pimeloyl-ACP methyl ester carboxylesterase
VFSTVAAIALTVSPPAGLFAQAGATKPRDSLPAARFVEVEHEVKLEVLDWGGTGRPVVLLAGLGNTAHVFEELAARLRADYHVYGVTRRGYGQSSEPWSGYSADRLGDDVLAVLDSLRISKPVLIGHSIAGEELSSIGSRRPDRVSGLVYLDAAFAYAFYDSTSGDLAIDLNDLRRKLDAFQQGPSRRAIEELLRATLPTFERDLREILADTATDQPALPQGGFMDRSSFAAFRRSIQLARGFSVPIAELRQQFEELPNGSVGQRIRTPEDDMWFSRAVIAGTQKHYGVSVPVLAIFANPRVHTGLTPSAKKAFAARDSVEMARVIATVRRAVPAARIVEVPNADHFFFLTNQAEVLREINAFMKSIK